jgi:hypothetical protein
MRGIWQKGMNSDLALSVLVEQSIWLVEEFTFGFVMKEERWDDQHNPRMSSNQALADFFEMSKLGWR